MSNATHPPHPVHAPGPGWVTLATHADRLTVTRGERVAVLADSGLVLEFDVKYPPWKTAGVLWVLGLHGVAGCYDLNRVVAVKRPLPELFAPDLGGEG